MSNEKSNADVLLKVWEKTVDVQMHFNDLCLKVRYFAISILGVLLGGAAISYRFGGDVFILNIQFHIAAVFVAISIVVWLAFYYMDRYWYHELLRGAVRHGKLVENSLRQQIPVISLAASIRQASHASLNKNAASKLDWFYMIILGVQILALLVVTFCSIYDHNSRMLAELYFSGKGMYDIFTSVDFWKFSVPLFGAVVAWLVNEWRKRIWEQYQRKEEGYKELLRCLKGFYVGSSAELKSEFLNQLNRCWLYCPDNVIKKGYAFLDTVHTSSLSSDQKKEKAMGDFVAAIRSDLLSRKLVRKTLLTGEDFKHLDVN